MKTKKSRKMYEGILKFDIEKMFKVQWTCDLV